MGYYNYEGKNNQQHDHHHVENENCVADVVRGIVKAQDKAVEAEEDTCITGCDRSIEDLLSPFEEERVRHNTIPFMLYCKGACKPFVGSGITKGRRHFKCVESPVFRAQSFVDDGNCVRLELLLPVEDDHHGHHDHHGHGHDHHHGHDACCNQGGVCDFFDGDVSNFKSTGICITVDLDNFFGISCLDPITPVRAGRRERDHHHHHRN